MTEQLTEQEFDQLDDIKDRMFTPEDPLYPPDFVAYVFLQVGAQTFYKWLHENAPEHVKALHSTLEWAQAYSAPLTDGKVPRMMNEEAKKLVPQGLKAMMELGEEW